MSSGRTQRKSAGWMQGASGCERVYVSVSVSVSGWEAKECCCMRVRESERVFFWGRGEKTVCVSVSDRKRECVSVSMLCVFTTRSALLHTRVFCQCRVFVLSYPPLTAALPDISVQLSVRPSTPKLSL